MEQTCKHSWRVLKRVICKPGECEMQCDDENDQAKNNLSSKFRICKRTHFIVLRNWDNMEQNWDNMVVGGTGIIWKELFTNLGSASCSAMMGSKRCSAMMEQNWDNMVVWRNWDNMKRVIYKPGKCEMQAMIRMTRPKTIWAASLGSVRGLIL